MFTVIHGHATVTHGHGDRDRDSHQWRFSAMVDSLWLSSAMQTVTLLRTILSNMYNIDSDKILCNIDKTGKIHIVQYCTICILYIVQYTVYCTIILAEYWHRAVEVAWRPNTWCKGRSAWQWRRPFQSTVLRSSGSGRLCRSVAGVQPAIRQTFRPHQRVIIG
jgi:hypothetical protein